MLTSRLYIRAAEIVSRRSGRQGRLSIGRGDDGAMSILIGIMGVSPEVSRHRVLLYDLHRAGTLQRMLGIPLEAPASDLPAFAQAAASSKGNNSSSKHKRFSRSPSPPPSHRSGRSPPRIAQQKQSLGAIHVEDDSESDANRRASGSGVRRDDDDDGYDSSDSDLSFAGNKPFKDKPFIPSTKKGAAPAPKASSSSLSVQSGSKRPARKSPSPVPPRRSESPDDSRYSVGIKPAAKRLRTSRQHSFSPAPTSAPSRSSKASAAPVIELDDSSSEEGQVRESSYIEGQEELIPSDEDEDDLMRRKGKRTEPVAVAMIEEDEEDDEARRERKAGRRRAREAKRAFWAGKSGTGGRMGGMDSD